MAQTQLQYQRVAISLPSTMATMIDQTCKAEGRNRSEFFREAARHYISTRARGVNTLQSAPAFVLPTAAQDAQAEQPFHGFTEWNSAADDDYDVLR
jgi:metal-responsive CopG/Arc/MetJ family transcriptional regulator